MRQSNLRLPFVLGTFRRGFTPRYSIAALLCLAILSTDTAAESTADATGRAALRALDTVAVVGETEISIDELRNELHHRGGGRPGIFESAAARRQVLKEMVEFELQVQAARAAGYEKDPAVQEVLRRVLVARFSQDRLQAALQEFEILPEEVEAFYRAHREDYAIPERRQGAVLFFRVPPHATEEVRQTIRAKAEHALQEARRLAPEVKHLGDLARRLSDDRPSRYQGGVIGWLAAADRSSSRLPQAVGNALFELDQPGQLAPLVEIPEGFYVVRLVATEARTQRSFETMKDGLEAQLLQSRRAEARKLYLESLTATFPVRIDDQVLKRVEAPVAATPPSIPMEGNR